MPVAAPEPPVPDAPPVALPALVPPELGVAVAALEGVADDAELPAETPPLEVLELLLAVGVDAVAPV